MQGRARRGGRMDGLVEGSRLAIATRRRGSSRAESLQVQGRAT
jgi:hypothetical protein